MQQLADNVDVSYQTVSAWERGKVHPRTAKIQLLAKLFSVSESSLMSHMNAEPNETEAENQEPVQHDLLVQCNKTVLKAFLEKNIDLDPERITNIALMLYDKAILEYKLGKTPIIDHKEVMKII